jgi:hypothetical protein
MRRIKKSRPGALTTRKRHRPLVQQHRADPAEREEDDGTDGPERQIQIRRLGPEDLVGGDRVGLRPVIELRREHRDRDEQQHAVGEEPRPRFPDAPPHQAPLAARHVLEHQQRQAAARQAGAEHEPDQPRRHDLRGLKHRPDAARHQAGHRDHHPLPLQAVDAGRVGRRQCVGRHSHLALVLARRGPGRRLRKLLPLFR